MGLERIARVELAAALIGLPSALAATRGQLDRANGNESIFTIDTCDTSQHVPGLCPKLEADARDVPVDSVEGSQ